MKIFKNKSIKETFSIFGLIALIGLIIYSIIDGERARKDMKKNYCYTIATTEGKKYIPRQGTSVIYNYKVYGRKHKSARIINGRDIKLKGGLYLLKVYTKNPSIDEVYFEKPIVDSAWFRKYYDNICPGIE